MMKRKYSALLAVAGAAVMLGGCNIYRPYSRPQMETAGLYRDTVSVTDTLSGDTVNFGNRPWQEVFTDPKLQSLCFAELLRLLSRRIALWRARGFGLVVTAAGRDADTERRFRERPRYRMLRFVVGESSGTMGG